MKILLYGLNYSPELTGIGKYSGEMAEWFAKQGHDVRVVTAPPYYPDWEVWNGYSSMCFRSISENDVKITRCPIYVPRRPTSIKRMIHLASFSLSSSLALMTQLTWRPDVVIQVAPTMFCSPFALMYCKLTGAKSVLHIQDFEVDALFGLGMASSGRLKQCIFKIETFLYSRFDKVTTISPSMVQRAIDKGVLESKTLLFPNWSETTRFCDAKKSPDLMEKLGVPPSKKILLYSGNLGEKQGLETLISAAEKLQTRKDIVILIVGEGASKTRLQESVKAKNLENVIFGPLQPYEDLPALLASANVHLVIQKRGAADAVLPSKLTNILAVGGNAVITADQDTSLGALCNDNPSIATRVGPESTSALLEGIEVALTKSIPNPVATKYALENLDKEYILSKFESQLLKTKH